MGLSIFANLNLQKTMHFWTRRSPGRINDLRNNLQDFNRADFNFETWIFSGKSLKNIDAKLKTRILEKYSTAFKSPSNLTQV